MSPLHRRKLLFYFDQEEGWLITPKVHKRRDPSDLTEGLSADMDLAALRPPAGLKVGDKWLVLKEELVGLFRPAGDMHLEFKDSNDNLVPAEMMLGMEDVLTRLEKPLGELELTASRLKHVGGAQEGTATEQPPLGVWFDVKLTTSFANKTEIDTYELRAIGLESFHHRIEFEGEGSGSWNNEHGFVESLLIEGTITIIRTMKVIGIDEHEGRFSGTFKVQVDNTVR